MGSVPVEILVAAISTFGLIGAAWLALKGTRQGHKNTGLEKAVEAHSSYADRVEKRLDALEKDHEALKVRLEDTEKKADEYKEESNQYRGLISEVIEWITELIDWENKNYEGPEPRYSLKKILTHLSEAITTNKPRL